MINVYHCSKCGFEWESVKYEFACPKCGADVEIMVELSPNFWHQMMNNLPETQQDSERKLPKTTGFQSSLVDVLTQLSETRSTTIVVDRRREIEDIYRTKGNDVRHMIEEHIKGVVVDSKDNNFLTARVSENGKIEIVDQSSGKAIPWHRLNDDEQWALWLSFNDLIDEIDKISR
jgi:hypothetical protein